MATTDVLQSVQYMVDEDGKRTAAVIQIHAWESLLHLLDSTSLGVLPNTTELKTPEEVVAHAQARPLDPAAVIAPCGSLLDVLQNPSYQNEEFDLDSWTKQWSAVENEMRAITRRNDVAEGRG